MNRKAKLKFMRQRVDLNGIGLELGPHVDPMFRKSKGDAVKYLETRSTEQLREFLHKLHECATLNLADGFGPLGFDQR